MDTVGLAAALEQTDVVPAGVEHRPRSEEGASILMIEPEGTPNTGDLETAASELDL